MKNILKQETLEEAAEKLLPIFQRSTAFGSKFPWTPHKEREVFKKGAKWQQKRSYSEEEVHNIITSYKNNRPKVVIKVFYNEWFEQFKKK